MCTWYSLKFNNSSENQYIKNYQTKEYISTVFGGPNWSNSGKFYTITYKFFQILLETVKSKNTS